MTPLQAATQLLREQSFVSIREIQKSPSRALNGFKIILNKGKMQGIYIPQEDVDDYVEDLEALASPQYLQLIAEARKSQKIDAAQARDALDVVHGA
ncbi:MAG: hypothetical protein H6766_04765 [Candidatus Peribacteria bacterium]|nr:MAG: hypothetical protein H6766_04765 [Candidatus Peribacteria bacterium]